MINLCQLCETISAKGKSYLDAISKNLAEDLEKLPTSTGAGPFISNSEKIELAFPIFEPKAAYSSPIRYFQKTTVDGVDLPCIWTHRSTRAFGFSGKDLVVLSKFPKKGVTEGLHSFVFLKIPIEKIKSSYTRAVATFTFSGILNASDLKTGNVRDVAVSFTFTGRKQQSLSRKDVHRSTLIGEVYGAGAEDRLASSDMAGYVITVPHFSPHPYILNICKELGFASRYALTDKSNDFVRMHLGLSLFL